MISKHLAIAITLLAAGTGSLGAQQRPDFSGVWRLIPDESRLTMAQHASTPHGDFEARDRLMLADAGQRLVFERVVVNERGERTVRQVLRKVGPHPPQRDE